MRMSRGLEKGRGLYILGQLKDHMRVDMDYIQTYNQRILDETIRDVRYICTELPDSKEAGLYEKAGIRAEQMVNAYQYFTDGLCIRNSMHGSRVLNFPIRAEDKMEALKNSLEYTSVEYHGLEIWLVKEGYVVATIFLNEKEKDYARRVSYFSYTRLVRSEIYMEEFAYVESYITVKSENGLQAKLVRRSFHNGDGSVAYEQIFEGEKEWYLFPDGRRYMKRQFIAEFVKQMLVGLSKEDVVLLDGLVPDEIMRAVFTYGKAARIAALCHVHSDYVGNADSRESIGSTFCLREYPYLWFPYVELLDVMVVSTKPQKEALERKLRKYHCGIPNIKVMPIEGEFTYVVIYESYGGNMALSWKFSGKLDGLWIYDEFGKVICETRNVYQHYFLIKGYENETGFILKAFVDTAEEKVVVAESEIVHMSTRRCEKAAVSLIIPAYNAEDFIVSSIDTALAQSLDALEIIIVNDGSTDKTQEVIDWYKERFPQVQSFYQLNAGQGVARNFGVAHANGDYIGFLDSDDMLCPTMLERLYDSIVKNDCDIAQTTAYEMNWKGYREIGWYPLVEDTALSSDEFFEQYIIYADSVVWNKLYRKSLVREHPMPKLTYEDTAWVPCILSYAERLCYLNEHLYEYNRMQSSTYVTTALAKPIEEMCQDCREFLTFFLEHGNPQKKNLLKRLALGYALWYTNTYSYSGFKKLWQEMEQWSF